MIKHSYKVTKQISFTPHLAAAFVQMTEKYQSRILLESGNKKANGKSLMGMVSIGIEQGAEITFIVDGPDQDLALEGIIEFFDEA